MYAKERGMMIDRHSLKMKINFTVVLSFITLFLLLHLTIKNQMEETVVPLNINLTSQIVGARGDQIAKWIDQRQSELTVIGDSLCYGGFNRQSGMEYLGKILADRSDIFESFGLVDGNGDIRITDGARFSIGNREYYRQIRETDRSIIISNPIRSRSDNSDIVVMLYRLPVPVDGIVYLSAAVPIWKLKSIASEIYVYDGVGEIRYNPGSSPEDESRMVFTAPIQNSPGWELVFKISREKLREDTKKIQEGTLLTGVLVGSLMILLLTFFGSSIVKPIRQLQILMKQIEQGHSDLRCGMRRKDEIGDLADSFNTMLDEIYKAQYEKKEIALKLMQEQIKPHFLYNTLDTIQWMARDYEADELVSLIEALSTYFRIGLSRGETFITLEEELDHIESYLQIQKARYEKQLDYSISYDGIHLDQKILRILIQPLVENAIDHGVKYQNRGQIEIELNERDGCTQISVRNNGPVMDEQRLIRLRECLERDQRDDSLMGFGLYSVNHRVRTVYGAAFGVALSQEAGWFAAVITLPGRGGSHV